MMNSKSLAIGFAGALFAAAPLIAATGSRNLVIVVLAPSSITVTIPSADPTLTNPGSNASISVGTPSKFGNSGVGGFTQTKTSTSWTMATNFVVLVTKSNLTSASYTLKAIAVANSSFPWATWKIDGIDITSPITGTITTTGTYDVNRTCALSIDIQTVARSSTALSDTITLTATGN
jgi:hypothetical protein